MTTAKHAHDLCASSAQTAGEKITSMLRFDYDQLDSTHNQAKRLMNEHPGRAMLVTAATQSEGRGRSGRPWQSPRGGAWFSIVWPIERWDERYTAASLVVGWAVLRSIEPLLDPQTTVQIKWPNDLLINDHKIAGVLCERVQAALLIGVGINVNIDREQLGEQLRLPATTLRAATGRDTDLACLIEHCTTAIEQSLTSLDQEGVPDSMIQAVEERLAWRSRIVTLRTGEHAVSGVCVGLDPEGRLLLEINGQHMPFSSGEVDHLHAVAASV